MMYPSNVAATAISYGVGSGETDLPVEDGSTYPDPTAVGMEPYKVLVGYSTSREEVCLVTSKPTANTLRVTRGYDSSPATAKNTGDIVVPGLTAVDATSFAAKVAKAGDTMTGPLVLSGNPTTSNQAANKSYVDTKAVIVYRQATAPSSPKEGDVWIKDYTSGLVDKAPGDVLTNAARWSWAGFGYNAGTSFVAEAGGMRITYAAGVSNSAGCVGGLGLTAGRSYRLEALLEVPGSGSNPSRLIETFTATSGYAAAGATTRLVLDVPYSGTTLLGINADGSASGGSVLVKEFHVYDVTDALPEARVYDDVNGWCHVRDGWSDSMFLQIGGGTLTGALTLSGDPSSALHPATKQYVDTADGALLPKSGGTMTGAITLADDPAAAMQPATKQYSDARDNRVWARAVRTGQSLSASTWTQMTSWTLAQYGGITQSSGTLTVPAGLYLVTARAKTGAAGRLVTAVENGDASYGATSAWLQDARAAAASDVVAGSRLIYTSGSLNLWAYVGSATTVDMYVEVVRLGGQNAA